MNAYVNVNKWEKWMNMSECWVSEWLREWLDGWENEYKKTKENECVSEWISEQLVSLSASTFMNE